MNAMRVIFPYNKQGVWMFDDAAVGLKEEPFVIGIPAMIDKLVSGIEDAKKGFALYFSDVPFPEFQVKTDWIEEDAIGSGNWYATIFEGQRLVGWICPALFKYFAAAPKTIYVKAEARVE